MYPYVRSWIIYILRVRVLLGCCLCCREVHVPTMRTGSEKRTMGTWVRSIRNMLLPLFSHYLIATMQSVVTGQPLITLTLHAEEGCSVPISTVRAREQPFVKSIASRSISFGANLTCDAVPFHGRGRGRERRQRPKLVPYRVQGTYIQQAVHPQSVDAFSRRKKKNRDGHIGLHRCAASAAADAVPRANTWPWALLDCCWRTLLVLTAAVPGTWYVDNRCWLLSYHRIVLRSENNLFSMDEIHTRSAEENVFFFFFLKKHKRDYHRVPPRSCPFLAR